MENKLFELDLDEQAEGEHNTAGRKIRKGKITGRGMYIQITEEFRLAQKKTKVSE